MTDDELIRVYEATYKEEFDKNFEVANAFHEQARDKKYALEMGLGIVALLFAFRNSSEFEKEIMQTYDHIYKLGGTVANTIRAIPKMIEEQKVKAEEWHSANKNEVAIEYKRFLGIPYWVKEFRIKPSIRMGSPFESLTTEKEIAEELGRQRALIDLMAQLKAEYIKAGGLSELKENDLLPVKFEKIANLKAALAKNDLETFFKLVQEVFATMSYDMKITEGYFHSHIHLLLTLLDFDIVSEVETNKGRIDSVIETNNYLHIMEFKQNDSSIAIDQIKNKEYYQKYFSIDKRVILVGVAVDAAERNVIDWQMQTFK